MKKKKSIRLDIHVRQKKADDVEVWKAILFYVKFLYLSFEPHTLLIWFQFDTRGGRRLFLYKFTYFLDVQNADLFEQNFPWDILNYDSNPLSDWFVDSFVFDMLHFVHLIDINIPWENLNKEYLPNYYW